MLFGEHKKVVYRGLSVWNMNVSKNYGQLNSVENLLLGEVPVVHIVKPGNSENFQNILRLLDLFNCLNMELVVQCGRFMVQTIPKLIKQIKWQPWCSIFKWSQPFENRTWLASTVFIYYTNNFYFCIKQSRLTAIWKPNIQKPKSWMPSWV